MAVWGLREASAAVAHGQAPAEWRPRYSGGPVPAPPAPDAQKAPAAQVAQAAGSSLPGSASAKSVLVMCGREPRRWCCGASWRRAKPAGRCRAAPCALPAPDSGLAPMPRDISSCQCDGFLLGARAITLELSSVGFVLQQRTLVGTTVRCRTEIFGLQARGEWVCMGEVVTRAMALRHAARALAPAPPLSLGPILGHAAVPEVVGRKLRLEPTVSCQNLL